MKVDRGYRRNEHRDSQARIADEFISREGATAMSRRAKNANGKAAKPARRVTRPRVDAGGRDGLPANYWKACELVRDGQYGKARNLYGRLERVSGKANARLRVLVQNDLAVLAAMEGNFDDACERLRAAIEKNCECLPARVSPGLFEAELSPGSPHPAVLQNSKVSNTLAG